MNSASAGFPCVWVKAPTPECGSAQAQDSHLIRKVEHFYAVSPEPRELFEFLQHGAATPSGLALLGLRKLREWRPVLGECGLLEVVRFSGSTADQSERASFWGVAFEPAEDASSVVRWMWVGNATSRATTSGRVGTASARSVWRNRSSASTSGSRKRERRSKRTWNSANPRPLRGAFLTPPPRGR